MEDKVSPQTNGQGKPEAIKLSPNLDMALDFLKALRPDGPWVLTAIKQFEQGPAKITTRTFTNLEAAREFIAAWNVDHNIYYNPNRTKTAVTKKPSDDEMAQADFVFGDLDPNDDESPTEAKARFRSRLDSFHKPTFLVDSGNGIQPLWKLDPPLGAEHFDAVKRRSKAAMILLGSKDTSAHDISRVLRLPGTINHPTPTKLKKGRVPCMSRLIDSTEQRYALDDFPSPETGPGSPEDGGQHDAYQEGEDEVDLDRLIRTGGNVPVGERSHKVWHAVNEMLRQGYARSAILSVLLDKNNHISDHILAQPKSREYAIKQIEDAAKAVGDAIPRIRSIEIRPGHVETFKVSIGGGTIVVDAEALNYFPWFNRAAIAQLRRSFAPVKAKAWSSEVDRALRAAKEPVPLAEEQIRFHGTEAWRNEPVAWLVRERLPEQGVGLLSGMYSTFKSFVLLDLCGSVMTRLPFLKARTTRRGGVLVFAAEGAYDLPMRVKALIDHRLARETVDDPDLFKRGGIDLDRLPFGYVGRCRPLLDPKTVDWMVIQARNAQDIFQNQFGLDLVLIGIDTMSAAAGWEDENDAAQAQIVMNHLADVSKATKAFVLAADHFGKDISAGTRGSGVKENSADTILAVLGERDEETNTVDDTRVVVRKQRSGPQGDVFPFEARLVNMGEDSDHEPLTSRVIDWNVERSEPPEKPKKKTEAQLTMEQALAQALTTKSERITVNGGVVVEAVREEQVRPFFDEMWRRNRPDIKPNALRQARWQGYKAVEDNIMKGTFQGVQYLWYPPGPI